MDGFHACSLQERRQWLLTAVGIEAATRGEAWDALYERYLERGGGWLDLVAYWNDAAGPLNHALLTADNPDVGLTLTVERYVSAIYGHFNREGELPSRQQLLALADAAVAD